MTTPSTEVCENCGHVIGRLETAMVWGEKIVCANCHIRLRNEVRTQSRKNWWLISAIAVCGLSVGLAGGLLVSHNLMVNQPTTSRSKPPLIKHVNIAPLAVRNPARAPGTVEAPWHQAKKPRSMRLVPPVAKNGSPLHASNGTKPPTPPVANNNGKPTASGTVANKELTAAKTVNPSHRGFLHDNSVSITLRRILNFREPAPVWGSPLSPWGMPLMWGREGNDIVIPTLSGEVLKINAILRKISPLAHFAHARVSYVYCGAHGGTYLWLQSVNLMSQDEVVEITPKTHLYRVVAKIRASHPSPFIFSCGGMAETPRGTLYVAINKPRGYPPFQSSVGRVLAIPRNGNSVVVARFKTHQIAGLYESGGDIIGVTCQSNFFGRSFGDAAIFKVGTHFPLHVLARFKASDQIQHGHTLLNRFPTAEAIPGYLSLPIQKGPGQYLYGLTSLDRNTRGSAHWIFRISRKTGHVRVVMHFDTRVGRNISGFAVESSGDVVVATNGGPFGFGELRRYTRGHKAVLLVRFSGPTGVYPRYPLEPLYGGVAGFTIASGPGGHGTIFFVSHSGAITAKSLPAGIIYRPSATFPGLVAGATGTFYLLTAEGGNPGGDSLYAINMQAPKAATPLRSSPARPAVAGPPSVLRTVPEGTGHKFAASAPPVFGIHLKNVGSLSTGGYACDLSRPAEYSGGHIYYEAGNLGAANAPDSVLVKRNIRTGGTHALLALGPGHTLGSHFLATTRYVYAFDSHFVRDHLGFGRPEPEGPLVTSLLRVNIATGYYNQIVITRSPLASPSCRIIQNRSDKSLYVTNRRPVSVGPLNRMMYQWKIVAIPHSGVPYVLWRPPELSKIGASVRLHNFGKNEVVTTSSGGNFNDGYIFIIGRRRPAVVLRSFRIHGWTSKSYPNPGVLPAWVPLPGLLSPQGLVIRQSSHGTADRAYGLTQLWSKKRGLLSWAFEFSSADRKFKVVARFGGRYGPIPTAFAVEPNGTMVFTNRGGRYGFGQLLAVGPHGNRRVLFHFSPSYGVFPMNQLITLRDGIFGWTTGGRATCFLVPYNGSPVRIAALPPAFSALSWHPFIKSGGDTLWGISQWSGARQVDDITQIDIQPSAPLPKALAHTPHVLPIRNSEIQVAPTGSAGVKPAKPALNWKLHVVAKFAFTTELHGMVAFCHGGRNSILAATNYGGQYGNGTIFRINISTGVKQALTQLKNPLNLTTIIPADTGAFAYSNIGKVVCYINRAGALKVFRNAPPCNGISTSAGTLYGESPGQIFGLPFAKSATMVLHPNFVTLWSASTGRWLAPNSIDAKKGNLFGLGTQGNEPMVFMLSASGKFRHWPYALGNLVASQNCAYGAGLPDHWGGDFPMPNALHPWTGDNFNVYEFSKTLAGLCVAVIPRSADCQTRPKILMDANGNFYGSSFGETFRNGKLVGGGTIFHISRATGSCEVLAHFFGAMREWGNDSGILAISGNKIIGTSYLRNTGHIGGRPTGRTLWVLTRSFGH